MLDLQTRPRLHDQGSISTVERVNAVLGAFGPDDNALTCAEIARRTGMPRITVWKIVQQLVDLRFIEKAGNNLWLGIRVFELGELAARPRSLRRLALPSMIDLQRATGQAVSLAVLDGADAMYVEVLPHPDHSLPSLRAGVRRPATATALGKAMLALASPRARERALAEYSHEAAELEELRAELHAIWDVGLAHENDEVTGAISVASPVLGQSGHLAAGICVAAIPSDIDPASLAPAVRLAARKISSMIP